MKLKNKYLISLDLDGTLLKDNKKICIKTIFYLRKLSHNNCLIVLTSGRPYRAIEKYYKQLKLNSPVVCYNGSLVFTPNKPAEPNYSVKYSQEDIKKLISRMPKNLLSCIMCEDDENIWATNKEDFIFLFYLREGITPHYGNVSSILDNDPYVCIFKFTQDIEEKSTILDLPNGLDDIKMRFWHNPNFCEIYHDKINKATAIKFIAEKYKIDSNNIFTFGDADNDYELITSFKNGVAMCNSHESVFNFAKNITKKDNNHNGIVYYLKEHLK